MKKIVFFMCLVLSTIGCGSDSGSTAPVVSEAEGLYHGHTNTNRETSGIILEDGTFYIVYSVENNPDLIAGVLQGNCTTNSGNLTSSNAKDFNIEASGIYPATITASYSETSLNGTVSYNNGTSSTFLTTYDSTYENTPYLSDLAGTFNGAVAFSLGTEDAILTILPNGTLSGVGESGCEITGTITPRSSGDVYNVSISFGDDPCYYKNKTITGIGYYDINTGRLWLAALTSNRSDCVIFVGTKPQ